MNVMNQSVAVLLLLSVAAPALAEFDWETRDQVRNILKRDEQKSGPVWEKEDTGQVKRESKRIFNEQLKKVKKPVKKARTVKKVKPAVKPPRNDDGIAGWVKVGLGAGYMTDNGLGGISGVLSANFRYKILFVSIRTAGVSELNIFGPEPGLGLSEISPMVGLGYGGEYVSIAVLAGVGVVYEVNRGELIKEPVKLFDSAVYETIRTKSVGFPVELQFSILATSHVGIGVDLIGNFNSKRTIAGALLSFQFGWF